MKLIKILENSLLDKPTKTPEQIAQEQNVDVGRVLAALKKGIKVEQEHTSDIRIAREIALDHLAERWDYYNVLAQAERAPVTETPVPGTKYVTLDAAQLEEALTYLQELAENIDSDSQHYSDKPTIYNKLDKDYKAVTAVEYVMRNNLKAFKYPELAENSIFLYDLDESDLSYLEFVGAVHVVLNDGVAEVKWIGSYDANGSGLLRAAMKIAKDRGAREMKLKAKWASEGFYHKMGFEQTGPSVNQPLSGSHLTPFSKQLEEASLQRIDQEDGDSGLEGYVVDTNQEQLGNYLTSQVASQDIVNQLQTLYSRIAIFKNLWVDEEQRGQGIGSSLLEAAIREAGAKGAQAIVMVAHADDSQDQQWLVKWYQSYGFSEVSKTSSGSPVMTLELATGSMKENIRSTTRHERLDQLQEVTMSPYALRTWVRQNDSVLASVKIGFEAEMCVKGLSSGDEEELLEPDYSEDEYISTYNWSADVMRFFESGEYAPTRREIQQAIEKCEEDFEEWFREEFLGQLTADAIKDVIADNNPDLEWEEIENIFNNMDDEYHDAMTDIENNFRETVEWEDFARAYGVRKMSEFAEKYNLDWPFMTSSVSSKIKDYTDLEDSWTRTTGYSAKTGSGYHTSKRTPGMWIFEPDSSIHPDDEDHGGVELVSPPMPFSDGIEALNKFFAWAPTQGAYANDSCGFHIGVSLPPEMQKTIDPVKLLLFLGDEHVLSEFGREFNTYTKSSMAQLRAKLRALPGFRTITPQEAVEVVKMIMKNPARGWMEQLLRTGDRYVSVNIRSNYIEFRSPGGDYFENQNKIVPTVMRFVRAMTIASDPQAEKQEYLKKMYKLLSGSIQEPNNPVGLFVKYGAGQISREELIQNLSYKHAAPSPTAELYHYEVFRQRDKHKVHEFLATSDQDAQAKLTKWAQNNNENPQEYVVKPVIFENFQDHKGPGRPGDSQRHGIPRNATMAQLKKAAKAKGRKGQLARWQINMRRGQKKESVTPEFTEARLMQAPAKQSAWKSTGRSPYQIWETSWEFQDMSGKSHQIELEIVSVVDLHHWSSDLEAQPGSQGWTLTFSVDGELEATGDLGASSARLFAEVLQRARGFFHDHKWDYIVFTGAKGSRNRMYSALAHILAKELRAKFLQAGNEFVISQGDTVKSQITSDSLDESYLQELFDPNRLPQDINISLIDHGQDDDADIEYKNYNITRGKQSWVLYMATLPRPNIQDVPKKHIWDVSFSYPQGSTAYGISGEGSAPQVFAAVGSILFQEARKNPSVKGYVFTAKEPSRVKLYQVLCKKLAQALYWVYDPNAGQKFPNHWASDGETFVVLSPEKYRQLMELNEAATAQTGAALTIFDIDDTLMHTSARVFVVEPNGHRRRLSASEFNSYDLRPGEKYDFSEFQDAQLFHDTSRPIEKIWRTAQNTLAKIGKRPGSRVIIVTARAEFDNTSLFLKTFEKHGMDMSKVKVYTVAGANNKKPLIRRLLEKGQFTEARIFDDHPNNLKDFLSLHLEFPNIKFKAFPVGHNGAVGKAITLGENS